VLTNNLNSEKQFSLHRERINAVLRDVQQEDESNETLKYLYMFKYILSRF